LRGETIQKNRLKRFFKLGLEGFKYESFLGMGFESIFISVTAGIFFGFAVGIYPALITIFPILPSANIILFIAFGIPITGAAHYDPRLGVVSSVVILLSARSAQLLFGIAPYTQEFLILAGGWSITQVFLIGYLPGNLIPTSENLGYLFKGLFKVTLLYTAAEYIVLTLAKSSLLDPQSMLVFPFYSIPLLLGISTVTSFIFTNTFCPYMMMPLISRAVKGHRQCSSNNFVFKLERPVSIDERKIKKASKKGFKLVSKLPSVTVFSCPRGGIISVYHTGEILMRKVNQGTAHRINKHLTPIIEE
jgi:hypothetical protein